MPAVEARCSSSGSVLPVETSPVQLRIHSTMVMSLSAIGRSFGVAAQRKAALAVRSCDDVVAGFLQCL